MDHYAFTVIHVHVRRKIAWNEAAPYANARAVFYRWLEMFRTAGYGGSCALGAVYAAWLKALLA
jgi:hypothetical protein